MLIAVATAAIAGFLPGTALVAALADKPAPKPVTKQAPKPVARPVKKPAPKPVAKLAAKRSPEPTVTVLCRKDEHKVTETGIDIRNNNFLGEPECLTNWNDTPGFMITKSRAHTPWAAFPNAFAGCEISVCSPNSGMPIQVRNIRSLRSSWRFVPARTWQGDAAYDIWFDPRKRTRGEDTGAEIMIWLDTRKLWMPAGPTVQIDGSQWRVSHWTAHSKGGRSWRYLRFWRLRKATSVRNLDLMAFLNYAHRHRHIRASQYLTSVEAGYELWSGGVGMHTRLFSVDLTAKQKQKPSHPKTHGKPKHRSSRQSSLKSSGGDR
jgi:hypothetical protein